jgi:hypothetical protein
VWQVSLRTQRWVTIIRVAVEACQAKIARTRSLSCWLLGMSELYATKWRDINFQTKSVWFDPEFFSWSVRATPGVMPVARKNSIRLPSGRDVGAYLLGFLMLRKPKNNPTSTKYFSAGPLCQPDSPCFDSFRTLSPRLLLPRRRRHLHHPRLIPYKTGAQNGRKSRDSR